MEKVVCANFAIAPQINACRLEFIRMGNCCLKGKLKVLGMMETSYSIRNIGRSRPHGTKGKVETR